MITFGIVGTGWRSTFYLRIARACPDRFRIVGLVTRDPSRSQALADQYGVSLFRTVDELLQHERPLFIVTSVPWSVNPGLLAELAEKGIPALSETPPATSLEELLEVWKLVEQGAQIEVAEQYWAQPHHAARIAFAQSGKLGTISQAFVSAAHGYHGISLIRRYLGIAFENVSIQARSFGSPIVTSPGRGAVLPAEEIATAQQTIAHFDFGDRLGIFDFTGEQYFSYIRNQRLMVRGERGEIIDQSAVYLQDRTTPIQVSFLRHSAGLNGNLEGNYLKGIQAGENWVYRNPLAPGELSDDEIAIGSCLLGMAEAVQGGPACYSLAEACQDRYLDILLSQALQSGQAVQSQTQPWARQ
jgi:predicted dehydrogenase